MATLSENGLRSKSWQIDKEVRVRVSVMFQFFIDLVCQTARYKMLRAVH